MGGFLSGLGELLGGFNSQRRIDKEGFDFREKQAAQQFARDREVELAGQADEDRAVNIGADIALGSEEGAPAPDFSGLLPGRVNQDLLKRRIGGVVAKSKPALEAQRLYNQREVQSQKGGQALELEKVRGLNRLAAIAATGEEREAIVRLQEDLLNKREPNPRDKFIVGEAAKRSQSSGGGKPQLRQTGEGEYAWLYPPQASGQAGAVVPSGARAPLPAAARESQSRGAGALSTINNLESLLAKKPEGEEWTGPAAKIAYQARAGTGKLGLAADVLGVPPPSGEQALFSSEIAQLGNRAIQDITGAQVGQHEVPRLFTEIPSLEDRGDVLLAKLAVTKARLNLLDQLRSGQITREQAIQQINSASSQSFLEDYRQRGLAGGQGRPIVQQSPSTGQYRHSFDGGKTWAPGRP